MNETTLYKDTVTDLNQGWRDLIKLYGQGDCKLSYLRQFEAILSQCLPGEMLWQDEEYEEYREKYLSGVPDDPRHTLAPGMFWNMIMLYERLMRKSGLIDKTPVRQPVSLAMFDLGDE